MVTKTLLGQKNVLTQWERLKIGDCFIITRPDEHPDLYLLTYKKISDYLFAPVRSLTSTKEVESILEYSMVDIIIEQVDVNACYSDYKQIVQKRTENLAGVFDCMICDRLASSGMFRKEALVKYHETSDVVPLTELQKKTIEWCSELFVK